MINRLGERLLLLSLFILTSCSTVNSFEKDIILDGLKLVKVDEELYVDLIQQAEFFDLKDTLKQNINLSWSEANQKIKIYFNQIDDLTVQKEYKLLLKSAIISDFVFAIFSNQFLGSNIGRWSPPSNFQEFNKLSLEERFRIANTNQSIYSCGEMSVFFNDLVKRYMNVDIDLISIPNYHTFPVVTLSNRRYIIDPYDPVFIFDNKQLVSYDDLLLKQYKDLSFYRTPRLFGHSHDLVSVAFYDNLIAEYGNMSFANLLRNFVDMEKTNAISLNTLTCYQLSFQDSILYQPVNIHGAKYATIQNVRMSRYLINEDVVLRDYLGETCKTVK